MSDPTELVITSTFGLALVLFLAASLFRWLMRPRFQVSEPAEETPPPPHGRVPSDIYQPLDLIGAGFVFSVYAALVILSLRLGGETEIQLGPQALISNMAFQIFLATIVTLSVAWRIRPVAWLGLRWRGWPWALLIAPVSVFGMWLFLGTLQAAGYMEWIQSLGVETTQDSVRLLQESQDPVTVALMAGAAVVVAPFFEEVIFRGYLYGVAKRFAGPWLGAVCSALVFSAAHGALAAVLPLFVLGLLLAFLYEKTGSLWASVSVHFCFNAATVAVQMSLRYLDLPVDPAP